MLAALIVLPLCAALGWYWITDPVPLGETAGVWPFDAMELQEMMIGPSSKGERQRVTIYLLSVSSAFLAGFLLIWALFETVLLYLHGEFARFRRTLRRSRVPILAVAILVVGLCFGLALAWDERSAVGRMTGAADYSFAKELDRNAYSNVRDLRRGQYERMRARRTGPQNRE